MRRTLPEHGALVNCAATRKGLPMLKAFIAALAVCFAVPASAGVTYDEDSRSVTVSGMTTNYLPLMLRKALAQGQVDTIYMWGPGGDYYAGLEIGRIIEQSGARVIIPSGKACISACAFSAVGANELHVDGQLWFHRPFTMGVSSMKTIEEIAGAYGAAYLDAAIYLAEMGFPATVTKQILTNTTPCKFIVVTDEEEVLHAMATGFFVGFKIHDACNG